MYSGGSGSNTLTFIYTFRSGDLPRNGDAIRLTLSGRLTGSAIVDAAGLEAPREFKRPVAVTIRLIANDSPA